VHIPILRGLCGTGPTTLDAHNVSLDALLDRSTADVSPTHKPGTSVMTRA
jgi:hypothetical protein